MKWSVKKLVTTAMLAAVAGVLMSLEFSIPFMPVFYKVDFSDVPTVIALFSMGPASAMCVEIIKIGLNYVIATAIFYRVAAAVPALRGADV